VTLRVGRVVVEKIKCGQGGARPDHTYTHTHTHTHIYIYTLFLSLIYFVFLALLVPLVCLFCVHRHEKRSRATK
jgi:hypothetical protein